MSKAFTKEAEGGDVYDDLPDRPISAHNLVTARGLELIEAELARLHEEHAAAQDADDRPLLAKINRDLRYWISRRATAQVIEPPRDTTEVHFGSKVTIERDDGRRQTYRIVGPDEFDLGEGKLFRHSQWIDRKRIVRSRKGRLYQCRVKAYRAIRVC